MASPSREHGDSSYYASASLTSMTLSFESVNVRTGLSHSQYCKWRIAASETIPADACKIAAFVFREEWHRRERAIRVSPAGALRRWRSLEANEARVAVNRGSHLTRERRVPNRARVHRRLSPGCRLNKVGSRRTRSPRTWVDTSSSGSRCSTSWHETSLVNCPILTSKSGSTSASMG